MKKTVYLLAALLALGCNTLEQNPVDKLFESNAFQTEADLKLYTNGFYSMLPSAYTILPHSHSFHSPSPLTSVL